MGLIDKNVLQEALREEYDRNKALYDKFGYIERGGIVQGLSYAEMILCKQTTIEAELVRHGRWIYTNTIGGMRYYGCTNCANQEMDCIADENEIKWYNYCPNCGAKMESEDRNEDSKM